MPCIAVRVFVIVMVYDLLRFLQTDQAVMRGLAFLAPMLSSLSKSALSEPNVRVFGTSAIIKGPACCENSSLSLPFLWGSENPADMPGYHCFTHIMMQASLSRPAPADANLRLFRTNGMDRPVCGSNCHAHEKRGLVALTMSQVLAGKT